MAAARRTASFVTASILAALALAPAAASCGGAVEGTGDDLADALDANARDDGRAHRDGGRDARVPGRPGSDDEDAPYVDPSCADAAPPPPTNDCDAREQTGCGPGEGCYPFVGYPQGPCEQEQYGTACEPAGTGEQGDPCGGLTECAAGYVCVISGAGTVCTKLCDLGAASACPEGQVCEPIDVAGFATCN